MTEMTTRENFRAEVTVTGTLSCIDIDGARPLTPDEFHEIISRMADHLGDESGLADPCVSGQARSGDMEIYFLLSDLPGPELNRRIADIIRGLGDAVGLIWANDPNPPSRAGAAPMLAQKSQHCDLVSVAA